ncbi:MAG: winged helix-turn-helix transcriptional regulator, partial [Clostridia bacterium]|nr:winged helix-turn-helix transcriptional regulator [Clostridia bacterium]
QTTQMPQNKIDDLFSRRVQHTLHNVVSPNQSLTFTQLKIFYEETGVDVTGDYFLQNLDLFTTDGKYNYAAYLLADNNGTSIKVARFNGTEKLDILERNEYGRCCLIKSAKNVLDRLKVANSTVVRVGSEAQRREISLIDEDALREAVLNAFIHNDYINGAYPVFEIYADRIEVVSSGGLPTGLSTDEFFAGRSLPRNKELMRIFSDLDMSEQLGTGMKKILQQYPKDIFDISEHFLSVKFMYNKEAQEIIDDPKVADKIKHDTDYDTNDILKSTENRVYKCIKGNYMITIAEIMNDVNKSRPTVIRAINKLKERGYIERIGSNRSGYWKVIK